jgi:hypothetical protein
VELEAPSTAMKIAAACTSPLWLLTTGMLWPA